MERIDSKTVYEGKLADVRIDKFRFQDGDEIERKVVEHPGSVAIVAYDDDHVHLIRQPREPVGDPALLEIPAGKMDVEGETRLECAKRELAEEIGLEASEWEEVRRFYTSPGLLTELVSVFFATEIKPTGEIPESADPDEHLELVLWPLGKLDEAIEACEDAKTLIGLLELQKRLA